MTNLLTRLRPFAATIATMGGAWLESVPQVSLQFKVARGQR